jgi:ABC-2 type transport system permease protein
MSDTRTAGPTSTVSGDTGGTRWWPAFKGVAAAIVKGFYRDRTSVFFAIIFPLMFLVLFGGIFNFEDSPRIDMVQVGSVPLFDDLPEGAREAFDEAFEVTQTDDREAAIQQVREGDADVAVEMVGDTLVAHYTQTDQVAAAMVQGTLSAFVDGANIAATGAPPTYTLRTEQVEDESLNTIQFVTPGLLGWAVAMSAAFGAAATLQGWRQSQLLRRVQLSPAPTSAVVLARIGVTIAIALVQMAIFLGLGMAAFGLRLTDSWWMSVPLLVCGTLSFMSLGLLAGAIAKTAEGAVNLANFFVLPMAFLSGSFFPLDAAPGWLQGVSQAMPLRHLNDGMLDVLVRGQGPSSALVPMGILLAFAGVIGFLAIRMFRWEG